MDRKVRAFGEVLTQQTVCVFIATSLPRALRVAEKHINICLECKALMIGELFSPVPCQRSIKFRREFFGMLDQGIHNCQRFFVGYFHQHHVTRMTLYQCRNKAPIRPCNEITFPMPGYRPVIGFCWPLTDRDSICNLPAFIRLLFGIAGAAYV